MTWTVFEHNVGNNETTNHAPGRGGYSYVLVPLGVERAVPWWEDTFENDPTRLTRLPEYDTAEAWNTIEHQDPEMARNECGEKTLEAGGIGVPKTRYYTWPELRSRIDVKVVTAEDL